MKRLIVLVLMLGVAGSFVLSGIPVGAASVTPVSLTADDKEFMDETARGGMAEVALGKLAATKAQNAKVKSFAQKMVADHSKANAELKALAAKKGVTLPADVTPEQQATHDRLAALSGAEFDREYMVVMVADHDKTVAAFEAKANDATDAELKKWVTKTLPTLKMHQMKAKSLHGG